VTAPRLLKSLDWSGRRGPSGTRPRAKVAAETPKLGQLPAASASVSGKTGPPPGAAFSKWLAEKPAEIPEGWAGGAV
jgi:hypothetical protein